MEDEWIEIWDRAAFGAWTEGRAGEGDVALGRALAFHGIAEGDGALEAVEQSTETETGLLDAMGAFQFLGLSDVAETIDSIFGRRLRALASESDERMAELEVVADQEYAELNVEERLKDAVKQLLKEKPYAFVGGG